jgi:hypothetical protein
VTLGRLHSVRRPGPVGYTHRAVAHYRRRPIVRAVALALVLWLGLDLAAAGACCDDEAVAGRGDQSHAALWTGGSASAASHSDSDAPSDRERGDRCFCCALVVGPAPMLALMPHLVTVAVAGVHPADRPGIRPIPYHPPL